MSKIFFIRHGQSVANAGAVTMPHAEIPLSPLGWQQARAVAGTFTIRPIRVLTSAYVRARETAAPLCQRFGVDPEIDADLHEFSYLDHTLIEGLTGAQRKPVTDAYWDRADSQVRMGQASESFAEFDDRVTSVLERLHTLEGTSVLVGHGIWFALLCWKLIGHGSQRCHDMRAFRAFQTALPVPNCCVYELEPANLTTGAWSWRVERDLLAAVEQISRARK